MLLFEPLLHLVAESIQPLVNLAGDSSFHPVHDFRRNHLGRGLRHPSQKLHQVELLLLLMLLLPIAAAVTLFVHGRSLDPAYTWVR